MPNFCICEVINDRAYDIQDPTCHVRYVAVVGIQLIMPVEYIFSILPDIKTFGWACKYINDSCLMPDQIWQYSTVGNAQTLDQNVNVTKHKYGL